MDVEGRNNDEFKKGGEKEGKEKEKRRCIEGGEEGR